MAELELADPMSTLRPLLKEIVAENYLRQCVTQIAPDFWSSFTEDMPAGDALDSMLCALQRLDKFVSASSTTADLTQCLQGPQPLSHGVDSVRDMLRSSLCLNIPPFFWDVVGKIYAESVHVWNAISEAQEDADQGDCSHASEYWSKFRRLVSLLHSLHLFHFTSDFAVSTVIENQIHQQIDRECSGQFDVAVLEDVTSSLFKQLLDWLQHVVGNSEVAVKQWQSQLKYSSFEVFANLRIAELFEIIVDFPDSEPALKDLALCLEQVEVKKKLISSLDKSFRKRLLHPGVNTADIITQYISAIKALRLVDSSGIVLEKVCGPVREYLYNREDTVRCIVASLTNDSDSDLAEELMRGESANNGLYSESDCTDEDFSSWMPDPVDANPNFTSATRKSSDIIGLLVNIYGSCEMFVSEYRKLLADRLLQMCSFDVSREVCTLELLKQRFGEGSLHFCEVMLKDIGDSKRINSAILSKSSDSQEDSDDDLKDLELQGLILSSEYWPGFREENLELPGAIQRKIENYSQEYQKLKGMRKLQWKAYLGMVDVEIECGGQQLSITVSPIRAIIIHQFQNQDCWSIDCLSRLLKAQPSVVRKHIGFWVSQGLLKEQSTDVYAVVQEQKLAHKGIMTQIEYEDESVMDTVQDTMEAELQVYWNYITHMLTNLGTLSLERIHTMLGMFGLQGNQKKSIGLSELKMFLEKKTVEQQLFFNNGVYSLTQ